MRFEQFWGWEIFAHAEDPVNPGGKLKNPEDFIDPNKPQSPENTQKNPEGQDGKESSQTRFRQSEIAAMENPVIQADREAATASLDNPAFWYFSPRWSGEKTARVTSPETPTANA